MANGHAAAQVPPPPLNGNAAQVPSAGPSEPALADSLDDAFSGLSSGKAQDTRVPVDKSFLAIPEIRRLRDKDDLRFVATQPCLVCGRQPAEAHHLRFAQPSAMGRKVSDAFTVPLCALHHRDLHTTGNERAWWERKKSIRCRLPMISGTRAVGGRCQGMRRFSIQPRQQRRFRIDPSNARLVEGGAHDGRIKKTLLRRSPPRRGSARCT